MSGIVAVLGARGQRSTNVRPEVSFTFDEIVALFDPNVVSYWKFQDTTGTDEKGIANATINGSPELNIPTIVKRDTITEGALTDGTCIAWPRTPGEYAQAPHNAAHKTANGTIVVYFQRDTSTAEKSQLIEADNLPAGTAGGMAIGINTNGAPDAYIRGAGGAVVSILGGLGDVLIDRAYTLIFKWGSPGMSLSLWDDTGFMVRRSTNLSTIGLSATSTIRFGATHATPVETNHHDGPYGRVVWMNRRITDNEEVLLAQAKSVIHSADLYRALELSLGPISLWGMGESAGVTIQDSVGGTRNGTFSGVIGYNFMDIPDNSINGAINFGDGSGVGTGSGSVPSTGLSLAAFTLSFWFRANTVPGAGSPALALVTKNGPTATAGDFMVFLPQNDGTAVTARFRSTPTVNVEISTPPSTIVSSTPYHVCVRADNTGFDLFVNGTYYGKNTTYLSAWTANALALQFATSPTFSVLGDTALDEIALFNRILTVSEVLQLAQRSGVAPVAFDDAAAIPEGLTAPISVLENDIYVGVASIDSSTLTQPTPGTVDTVAIVPAVGGTPAFINYAAANVSVNTARTFSYRIIDPNGISNTATVDVTIIADATVNEPNANCYVVSTADTITLPATNTMAALENEVNTAPPGRQILIPPGTYNGGTLTFTAQGTAANPIVIRPVGATVANPSIGRGSVIINSAVWSTKGTAPAASRLVFMNLFFNDPRITIGGTHHRITRCQFRQVNRRAITCGTTTDLRIDHCDFSGYTDTPPDGTNLTVRHFFDLNYTGVGAGTVRRVLFDYNHLHDNIAHINTSLDMELIGTFAASPANSGLKCGIHHRPLSVS